MKSVLPRVRLCVCGCGCAWVCSKIDLCSCLSIPPYLHPYAPLLVYGAQKRERDNGELAL